MSGLEHRFPNHPEGHSCGSGYGVQRRPARLIDNRHVPHFQCEGVSVGTDRQAALRNWNDPVKARRRNRRVKIVDLVWGNRRSPEESQSYMGKGALLRCARPNILLASRHSPLWDCQSDSISSIVGAHACEGTAPGHTTLEMVDMRRFEICSRWLIVAPCLTTV